jgi:hypothetical protein
MGVAQIARRYRAGRTAAGLELHLKKNRLRRVADAERAGDETV